MKIAMVRLLNLHTFKKVSLPRLFQGVNSVADGSVCLSSLVVPGQWTTDVVMLRSGLSFAY